MNKKLLGAVLATMAFGGAQVAFADDAPAPKAEKKAKGKGKKGDKGKAEKSCKGDGAAKSCKGDGKGEAPAK